MKQINEIDEIFKQKIETDRKPGDIDLVLEVKNILEKHNYPNIHNWLNEPQIKEAVAYSPTLQKMLISRNLADKLAVSDYETSVERFCLTLEDTEDNWLKNLDKVVAASLAKIENEKINRVVN